MKPQRPSFEEFSCSTKAWSPGSKFSSGSLAHGASAAQFRRAPLLRKGHVAREQVQFRQFSPQNLSSLVYKELNCSNKGHIATNPRQQRKEQHQESNDKKNRGDEIENEVSLRMTSHIFGVRSPKKKKKNKKQHYTKELRRSEQKWEQKAKKGSEPQSGCLALQNRQQKRTFRLLVIRDIKIEVQAQVGISILPLKGKPP